MTAVQTAKGVLADAEKALRELMQQEIKSHRYSELAELAGLADGLARLADTSPNGKAATSAAPTSIATHPNPIRTAPKTVHKRRSSKASYPRFERNNDKLVKIGWSKKSREEYEHRAPQSAVLAFAKHLTQCATAGSTFVVDQLLPIHDASGEELPSYQIYLALAWLRHIGIVEKTGRDGYVLRRDSLAPGWIEAYWSELPTRAS